jgi:orotate phosphoribosyltransferase
MPKEGMFNMLLDPNGDMQILWGQRNRQDSIKGQLERGNKLLKDSLVKCGAFKTGEFVLTSGKKSNFYVDIKQASTDPLILKEIAELMAGKLQDENVIAGMELGAVPLAVALSLKTNLPYIIIRKESRKHGTGKLVEGKLKHGDRVLLVEDVTTTGSSLLKAADIIKNEGGDVKRALVVVDREEGAKEMLDEKGLILEPLVKVSEMM